MTEKLHRALLPQQPTSLWACRGPPFWASSPLRILVVCSNPRTLECLSCALRDARKVVEVRLCRAFFCPDARGLLWEFLNVIPKAQTRKARMYKQDHIKLNVLLRKESTNRMKGNLGWEKIFAD